MLAGCRACKAHGNGSLCMKIMAFKVYRQKIIL